jgi:hypothetical protein
MGNHHGCQVAVIAQTQKPTSKGSFQASQKPLIYKESAGLRPPPVICTILILAKTRYEDAVGPVAQWLEPAAHNGLVPGSSPGGPTTCGRGGTGRRTGFRFQRRNLWGFESLRPPHLPASPHPPLATGFSPSTLSVMCDARRVQ